MASKTDKRRPIDLLREGAGSFEVRTPNDDSPISEMIPAGDRLLVVKGKGVYEFKFADQLDPERTNISTPHTIQQVIPFGAETPWVNQIILTAHHLFQSSCSPSEIDGIKAFALVLEISKEIAGACEIMEGFQQAEEDAKGNINPEIQKNRSFVMPALGNVETKCNEYIQRVDHALKYLFKLVQLFYSELESGKWDNLNKRIEDEPQDIDNFPKFLADAIPFFQLIRNARNCVEHPIERQRLIVKDFSLDSKNVLYPPMIEIIHPRSPQKEIPVIAFFQQSFEKLTNSIELMMVFLCSRHVKPVAAFSVQVYEFPPEHRRSKKVKYGYGAILNGQIVPMS